MKAFAISIPKPCHEDWNKMTPDAKGAFCASCQKSVYDFSNKTDEEIIAVFEKEEKGKVCGRFAPSQLSRPVISFGDPSVTRRLANFVYALFLAFGAFLFTGTKVYGQEHVKGEMKMGKVACTRPVVTEPKPETQVMPLGQAIIKEPIRITGDTVVLAVDQIDTDINIVEDMDDIKIIESIDTVPMPDPNMMVAGGVSYVQILETEPEIITPPDSNEVDKIPAIEETENMTPTATLPVDKLILVEEPDPLEKAIPVEEEFVPVDDDANGRSGIISENMIMPSPDLAVKVSPNPSRGEITLSYSLESAMPVRIDLYDSSGKMIRTLANQLNQYPGKYNAFYNIGDLRNGTYTAVLITSDRKVSAKVVLTK